MHVRPNLLQSPAKVHFDYLSAIYFPNSFSFTHPCFFLAYTQVGEPIFLSCQSCHTLNTKSAKHIAAKCWKAPQMFCFCGNTSGTSPRLPKLIPPTGSLSFTLLLGWFDPQLLLFPTFPASFELEKGKGTTFTEAPARSLKEETDQSEATTVFFPFFSSFTQ